MKVICLLIFALVMWAQPPAQPPAAPALPNLPDETVLATFDDGVKFTMADFRRLYSALPPQNQQMALRDRRNFIQQWGLMRKLAQMGLEQKLDEQSPTKEALEYYRMTIMSQAKISDV